MDNWLDGRLVYSFSMVAYMCELYAQIGCGSCDGECLML